MPGTTMRNLGPQAWRMARTSRAEVTTPSRPACLARRARATAWVIGVARTLTVLRAAASRLVRTVTPRRAGRRFLPLRASRAAFIMARPPEACKVRSCTRGSCAAAATAPATVFGMSWNFRSRKTRAPRAASIWTACGPSAVKSALPTLNKSATPPSCLASLRAGPRRLTSSATISRGAPWTGVKAPPAAPAGPWQGQTGQIRVSGQLRRRRLVRGRRYRGRDR